MDWDLSKALPGEIMFTLEASAEIMIEFNYKCETKKNKTMPQEKNKGNVIPVN